MSHAEKQQFNLDVAVLMGSIAIVTGEHRACKQQVSTHFNSFTVDSS